MRQCMRTSIGVRRTALVLPVGVPFNLARQSAIGFEVWPTHYYILSGFPPSFRLYLCERLSLEDRALGTKSSLKKLWRG